MQAFERTGEFILTHSFHAICNSSIGWLLKTLIPETAKRYLRKYVLKHTLLSPLYNHKQPGVAPPGCFLLVWQEPDGFENIQSGSILKAGQLEIPVSFCQIPGLVDGEIPNGTSQDSDSSDTTISLFYRKRIKKRSVNVGIFVSRNE